MANREKIYSEEYILNNIRKIDLNDIIKHNIYDEEFIETIINHLDLKTLVRNNCLSDDFLETHIYPYMDDHEVSESNILNWVATQRKNLSSYKSLSKEEKEEKIKFLNKIDKSLIDLFM
jgi:hypothetical protein